MNVSLKATSILGPPQISQKQSPLACKPPPFPFVRPNLKNKQLQPTTNHPIRFNTKIRAFDGCPGNGHLPPTPLCAHRRARSSFQLEAPGKAAHLGHNKRSSSAARRKSQQQSSMGADKGAGARYGREGSRGRRQAKEAASGLPPRSIWRGRNKAVGPGGGEGAVKRRAPPSPPSTCSTPKGSAARRCQTRWLLLVRPRRVPRRAWLPGSSSA